MEKELWKGNEAIAEAAIRAGCDCFFGYPITPQSEVPEYMSAHLPKAGGVFLQSESEVAAINMVYGAAGAGMRAMTSSSSPGISLKQEGITYIAGAELPCVIVNCMRGGPGLGTIQPGQGDYYQATRGGGNGDYRTLVLSPSNVQEAVDFVQEAFDIADQYRNPVMVVMDGLKPEGLLDPMVWVYALGQAFFSLSVAGNGTLIYGSYLSKEADVPESARTVAFFDSMAAILSALVIIPAMATAGETLTQSGPGLMFIYLPNLFREMPGGRILMAVFFVAALFAGVTSLVNLFEAPTATLQEKLHLSRGTAVAVIGVVGLAVGLCIQGIVSGWMDVCSIYACPIGALLAGVFFYWVLKKEDCLVQVNLARRRPLGRWFYPTAKYLYCGVTVLVLILGAVNGGIG